MGTTITTRVTDELSKDIKEFAKEDKVDTSTAVRQLLASAVKQKKIDNALEQYKKKQITIGKAAALSGTSLRDMISFAAKEEIPFQYGLSDLKDDYREAIK